MSGRGNDVEVRRMLPGVGKRDAGGVGGGVGVGVHVPECLSLGP